MYSPYSYALNDPIRFRDVNGDSVNLKDLFGSDPELKDPTGENFVSSLSDITGLSLSVDDNGNLSYEKGKINRKGTSRVARQALKKAINSKKTLTVVNNNSGDAGSGRGSFVFKSDRSKIYFDASQVDDLMLSASTGLNKNTVSYGMIFFHELSHTDFDPNGATEDPNTGHDISSADILTNKIRKQLGIDYGQNLSYLPYARIENRNAYLYVPFDKEAKECLEHGQVPSGKYIKLRITFN